MPKNVNLREWRLEDAAALAESLSDKAVHDNLRDGLPYPYTEEDGFQLEGTLRSNAMKNGKVPDMKMYAKVKG